MPSDSALQPGVAMLPPCAPMMRVMVVRWLILCWTLSTLRARHCWTGIDHVFSRLGPFVDLQKLSLCRHVLAAESILGGSETQTGYAETVSRPPTMA
nr:MAG TPA: hypothetical protein [Caudoviricetes sp.]